jgi:hypothetical protein
MHNPALTVIGSAIIATVWATKGFALMVDAMDPGWLWILNLPSKVPRRLE